MEGEWMEVEEHVAAAAQEFFQQQFTGNYRTEETPIMRYVQKSVTDDDNCSLNAHPTKDEIKKAVFSLNGDSASGPDGFTGHFYQVCWDIVGDDVVKVVDAFFSGATLPKSNTHTNLILLPKKDDIQSFSDLRPISLSNFINKVISKVMNDRIGVLLPSLISQNQSGFVKGKSITENVLLAQEIIYDIGKRGKPANMVIKLYMAKAYDIVE
uniref:Putative ovule protein n=1 Tax=Solanum chacoense TaxID=4108 RepID=A0A0V0IZZ6_SOLCH